MQKASKMAPQPDSRRSRSACVSHPHGARTKWPQKGFPERPVPATEKSPDREAGARLRWMPEAASLPGTSKTI